jgi:hypothetical protein
MNVHYLYSVEERNSKNPLLMLRKMCFMRISSLEIPNIVKHSPNGPITKDFGPYLRFLNKRPGQYLPSANLRLRGVDQFTPP